MAFQPVPNGAQVEMVYNWGDQVVENVYHLRADSEWSEGMLEDAVNTFYEWFTETLNDTMNTTVTLLRIVAKGLDAAASPEVTFACTADCDGTSTQQTTPNNVTAVVSLKTGFTGRSFRGRKYHIGLDEASYSGNILTDPYRLALKLAYDDIIDRLQELDEGIRLCILSRVSGGIERASGVLTVVTSCAVDAFVDSARRRLAGRGQ